MEQPDPKMEAVEISETAVCSSSSMMGSSRSSETERQGPKGSSPRWRKLCGFTLHYHPLSRVSKRLKMPQLPMLAHAILGDDTMSTESPKTEVKDGYYCNRLLPPSVDPTPEDSQAEDQSCSEENSDPEEPEVLPCDTKFFPFENAKPDYVMSKWYKAMSRGRCSELLEMLKRNPALLRHKGKGNATVLHRAVHHSHCELILHLIDEIFYNKHVMCVHFGNQVTLEDLLCERDDRGVTAPTLAATIGNRDIVDILHKQTELVDSVNQTPRCETNCSGIANDPRRRLSNQEKLYNLQMMNLYNPEAKAHHPQLPPTGTSPRTTSSQYEHVILPIVRSVLDDDTDQNVRKMKKAFRRREDYNSVPMETTFFHFLCGCCKVYTEIVDLRQARWNLAAARVACRIIERIMAHSDAPDLMYDLFDSLDPQGRTPLHVAGMAGYEVHRGSGLSCRIVARVLRLIPGAPEYDRCVNVRDGFGRTVFHQACSLNDFENWCLVVEDGRVSLDARVDLFARHGRGWESGEYYKRLWEADARLFGKKVRELLYWRAGEGLLWKEDFATEDRENECFYPTGLHLLILHGRGALVERLLNVEDGRRVDVNARLWRGGLKTSLTPVQLAAAVGHEKIVTMLLEHKEVRDNGKLQGWHNESDKYSIIHVAAAYKRLTVLKTIFQNKEVYDPMITKMSSQQESPLHLVALARKLPHPIMLEDILLEGDMDTLQQCLYKYKDICNNSLQKVYDANDIVCINFILQVGFDIWSCNKDGKAPYPGDDASIEAYKWWYEKVEAEVLRYKQKSNVKMVAILVIAALIAISSFIRPLQLLLGYDNIDGYIQSNYILVEIYFICNSLSFYFAMASILVAMTPIVLMRREFIQEEIQKSQQSYMIAIRLLFISIIAIFTGFGCSSIVAMDTYYGYDRKMIFYT